MDFCSRLKSILPRLKSVVPRLKSIFPRLKSANRKKHGVHVYASVPCIFILVVTAVSAISAYMTLGSEQVLSCYAYWWLLNEPAH